MTFVLACANNADIFNNYALYGIKRFPCLYSFPIRDCHAVVEISLAKLNDLLGLLMVDIFLEVVGGFFAAVIFFTVLRGLRHPNVKDQSGTRLVIAGFGLLFFSLLIDITDNFPELNYLVLIGDTELQAFLEKVVGMLLGLLLLGLGLRRWIPNIMALENTGKSLGLLNVELDQRVKARTMELESANRRLTCEIEER